MTGIVLGHLGGPNTITGSSKTAGFLQLPVEEEVETAGGKLRDPEV